MNFLRNLAHQMFVGVCSFASIVVLFSYFGNYDPPVSFLHAQAQAEPVKPGEMLTIHWSVERSRRCYTEFDREIYDGMMTRIDVPNYTKEGGLPITSREEFKTEVYIPDNAKPGHGIYRSTGLYSCNLFQRWKPIVVPAPEVHFTIAKRD